MQDTYRHKGLRKKLVETLIQKGIQDQMVLKAIGALPRHFFLEKAFEEQAYQDKAFPIDAGQTISQPYTVAFQSQLLDINKREKILEVGTGSGYQASILALLGARVYTIERIKTIYIKTKKLIDKMDVGNIRFFYKDGFKGLPEHAPFDKILITAGAPEIPEGLLYQLKVGGIMVAPIGTGTQIMHRITRTGENEFEMEKFGNFKFVPMLKNTRR